MISDIQEFYKGKSVFITGATGFLGKVLVEKLLRSCPDIDKVYVLARGKKGKNIQERIDTLTNVPLFDKLRDTNPNALKKIIAVEGDITEEKFGISEGDLNTLYENVGVVFHSAAIIKFDEPLRVATQTNMVAVKEILAMCHKMKNLKAMIHISTAFTNCDQMEAREVIYPRKYQPDDILQLLKTHSDEEIAKMTPSILGTLPNTYTFTKNLAEKVTAKEADKLPVAIVRPSIVTSTSSEPIAGWIDSYGGCTFFVAAVGQGLAKSVLAIPTNKAEIIPVDTTINLCIAAAWDVAVRKPSTMPIYNCTSGQFNSMNVANFFQEYSPKFFIKYPLTNAVSYPSISLHENELVNSIHIFFSNTIPAHVTDFYCRLTGKPGKLVKFYKIFHEYCNTAVRVGAFMRLNFISENPQKLIKTMSIKDQEIFPFDVRKINYEKYMEDYILGIRKYLLKQDQSPEALIAARKNMDRLRLRAQTTKYVFLGVTALSLLYGLDLKAKL